MKKRISHIVSLAAISGWIAITPCILRAQTTDPLLANPADQAQFPVITAQPLDQVVPAGSNAVLSVQAAYADNYQWQSNGVDIAGQTNSTLTLQNLGPNDAGLYSCNVSQVGADPVPTRTASVQVESAAKSVGGVQANGVLGGGPIVVSGTPRVSNGIQNPCPGNYAGYVIYSKTISQGWGWTPVPGASPLTASDGGGRTDTFVTYVGKYGDTGCGQATVTIPYPAPSPAYRFTIFFASDVPTTNYPLVLTNFNQ